MIPGEFPEALPGEVWYAAVRQLQPGVRMRWGFKWFGDERPDDLYEGEDAARIVFNLARETAGCFVPVEKIRRRMFSELPKKGAPEQCKHPIAPSIYERRSSFLIPWLPAIAIRKSLGFEHLMIIKRARMYG